MPNHFLPQKVAENLAILDTMNAAEISAYINARAGRVASDDVSAQTLINQFNLITEEVTEGKEAAARGDLTAVRDAVCDIVLLAFGQQGHVTHIDLDADFNRMCAFNMTRIPTSVEEALETQRKYTAIGISTNTMTVTLGEEFGNEVLYPVVCIDKEQWDTNGAYYPPRKFVKSAKFIDASFDEIPEVEIHVPVVLEGMGDLISSQQYALFAKTFLDKAKECFVDKDPSVLNPLAHIMESIASEVIGKRA